VFTSKPEHYDLNMQQAMNCTAKPALMTTETGVHVPAVVIFKSRQIQSVLPLDEALRLANEMADAIGTHHTNTTPGS
jgi:hypothetical protein